MSQNGEETKQFLIRKCTEFVKKSHPDMEDDRTSSTDTMSNHSFLGDQVPTSSHMRTLNSSLVAHTLPENPSAVTQDEDSQRNLFSPGNQPVAKLKAELKSFQAILETLKKKLIFQDHYIRNVLLSQLHPHRVPSSGRRLLCSLTKKSNEEATKWGISKNPHPD
ncbi:hypothetical protein AVEN_187498-1 [Araneus ventricosus]|uniref:Uncharacterized protein n=1 Tax=Araneus ventricosus TaxID=182803 RepID=A0A4Y2BTG4_ARAVE|nr:hypothetical protein AVEN_187498-1 [Araneus ventricosus]